MNFEMWNKIYEAATQKDLKKVCDSVASQLKEDMDREFYVLPAFEEFTRPNEPKQIGYLITDDEAHSMRLNFTEDGDLYSVDYWKANLQNPSITVYLNDLPIERAIGKLVAYFKNPTQQKIEENEEELTVTKPAPAKEADSKILKADKEAEYEFQNPREIFSDLQTYLDMVIDGDMYALLLTGQAGVGKTYLITKRLEERGLKKNEDYFKVTGKSTAAGMYITLFENNGKMILFDDCDSVFKDENAVNVLKGALDTSKSREISWNSAVALKTPEKTPIPKRFDFTGKVIFISNLPKKKIDPAIRSRAFVLEIALKKEDMIRRMWTLLPKVELPSGVYVKGTIKEEAMKMIVKASDESDKVELNMRTLVKAISIVNKIDNKDIALRLIKQQCAGV